ncbi:hypothetical protein SAMN04515667_1695 [Formosa sp. Hel1_31_208]|nr:hypothetical protein SAMN04515667_1695 [Formosa sp. Hel1_31_208]
MTDEIINCYELDIRQDIPVEMESLKSYNKELKSSNRILTIILLSIGLGVTLFSMYQSSKPMKVERENR